jgi:FtsH-binding integral membrane protein
MSYQAVGGGGDGAYGAGGAGGAQYQDLEAPRKPGRAGAAGAGVGAGAYQEQQQQHSDGFVPVGQNDAPFAEALAEMDVHVRHGFVRKVFGILSVQLLVTFGWVLLVSNDSGLRNYHATHTWPLFLGLALSLGSMIGMICFVDLVRSHPGNYIMLGVFTVAESLLLGGLGGTVDPQLMAVAVGTTLAVSVGIILFAMQTRFDFTGAGPYLFVALWSMIIFSMISSLAGQSAEQSKVYAGFGVVLFSFFLVYGALPSCPVQRPSLAVPSTDLFSLLLPRRRRPACRGGKAQQVSLLCRRLRLCGSCDLPRHHQPVPASSFSAFGPPLAAGARKTTVLNQYHISKKISTAHCS